MKLQKYKLSLMLLFGLSVQGARLTVVQKKDAAFTELYKCRKDSKMFVEKLSEHQSVFTERNRMKEPTTSTDNLKAELDSNARLFSEVARAYYEQRGQQNDQQCMRNVLNYILSEARNEELLRIGSRIRDKNAAFANLFISIRDVNGFMQELKNNAKLFEPNNDHCEQKWDKSVFNANQLRQYLNTKGLKDQLFDAIGNTYYRQGRPNWIKNFLSYIYLKSVW
jgi:excinuclease UvrABC ATPase subunit